MLLIGGKRNSRSRSTLANVLKSGMVNDPFYLSKPVTAKWVHEHSLPSVTVQLPA